MPVALMILAGALGLVVVAGAAILGRLRCRWIDRASAQRSSLSLIIPARNEAHNLPRLFASLRQQATQPLEVIVVDDGSTDDTAGVARAAGAIVIPAAALPEGWRGKPWACHQGTQAARGERLLFLDADTWFEPGGLDRLLELDPGGAFSVGPFHRIERPYEELSLFFNLAMNVGTVPGQLFGQVLLVDRAMLGQAGGYEAVRGRILETFWLAQHWRAAGLPVRSQPGRGLVAFRMYPHGLKELIEGWAKGVVSGAGQTPGASRALVIGWMIGLMSMPLGWAISGGAWTWGLGYAVAAALVAAVARRLGAFGWVTALLYPLPLTFFFTVFAWAAMRRGQAIAWKGRDVHVD